MKITGEYIQLNQLLKLMSWVNDGGMANDVIDQGLVKVDGTVETRRRNKIKPGMKVEFDGKEVVIS
jgi:ribosome-associated protein